VAEVVTHSILRELNLPDGGGRFALITLDNGLHRPATLGPIGLGELSAALDTAVAAGVVGIGITGVGKVLCAGAELSIFAAVPTRVRALELARLGHQVLGRLGQLPVPTFAFISGAAIGGGFEIALHCTYRTVTAGVGPLALPEVTLGIVPGWGGAWLLPNAVGIDHALDVIVDGPMNGGRTITGRDLAGWNAAHLVTEPEDFLGQSLAWASRVLRGEVVVEPAEVDRDEQRWTAAIDRARARVESRVHGATPAPYRNLELLARARSSARDDGFRDEDNALADLLMTDDNRAALYAFQLIRSRSKSPVGAPDPDRARTVRSVGIVGAGLMASQLALLVARRLNVPVMMTDLDRQRVEKALTWLRDHIASEQAKGRLSVADGTRILELVSGSVDKAALADADLVIEAIFEDLKVKTAMLDELEPFLRDDCVIATNTSSLSLTRMASALSKPQRFVGMHFFNPVARMALLEIVSAATTDDATLATAFVLGRALGKSCVLVSDAAGFAVNRVLTRMYAELLTAVDEGTDIRVVDRALESLGLPMSPFALLSLIGPAVQLHVCETLHDAWPDRFPVPRSLEAIVASGARSVFADDDHLELTPAVSALLVQGNDPSDAGEVLRRTRNALADEASRMLDEGVIGSAEDLDTCMLLGAGWPSHLGGITPWLDRSRDAEDSSRRFLAPGIASLPEA
jgi:3-hydroxyacyl-CoA dehydrogenase/enoyl-CoA hydratase/carnithine racemase